MDFGQMLSKQASVPDVQSTLLILVYVNAEFLYDKPLLRFTGRRIAIQIGD